MSMETLRQGAQSVNSGKGGGSIRSSYYARWKPPQMNDVVRRFLAAPPNEESVTQVAEPVVLVRGEYPDLFAIDPQTKMPVNPPPICEGHRFKVHTFKVWIQPQRQGQQGFETFKDIVCSAGPDLHAPQPCVGCYLVDHGKKDSKPKDQWAFNIAHLGWYHNSPLVKDNQIQMKRDNSGPVMIREECLSHKMENIVLGRGAQQFSKRKYRQCGGCQGQHPFLYGDHKVLQLGFKHLKSLFAIDDDLGKKCINCGTFVIRMFFNCGNPDCNARIVDIATTGWTNEQIDTFSKTAQQCGRCNFYGAPYSEYKCGFDERFYPVPGAGCRGDVEPAKMSIFDCVVWLQREGENTESDIVVKKFEPISTYRTHDGRSLDEHLKEIIKSPFNMGEMYAPDSLDDQANTIRQANPYAQQQPQFAGYPGQQPQVPQQGYAGPQAVGYPPQAQGWGQQPPQQPSPYGGQPVQYPNTPAGGRPNYGR